MQLSRFLVTREVSSDTVAMFNSLYPKPVFLTASDSRRIIDGSITDEEYHLLLEHYCLSSCDDELLSRYVSFNHETKGKIDTLYIILTTNCNLACDYCAVKHISDEHIFCVMSKETIKRAIDLFSQYCNDHDVEYAQICFYGGEPLAAFSKLQFAVSYCKEIGFQSGFSVVSNGTMVNEEYASFIKENHINISISLDGPQQINDINRKYRGTQKGSYKSALAGLKLLSSTGCSVGLSLTITNNIIENEEIVLEWIKSLPVSGVYCNLLHSSTMPLNEMVSLYEKSAIFCARIEQETSVSEGRFLRRKQAFTTSDFIFSDCAAIGINQLSIDPSGDIYYCHCSRTGTSAGNVHNIKSFESAIPMNQLNPWFMFAPIEREACYTCPGISLCGGGCYGINTTELGSEIDIPYCHYTLRTLDIILSRMLNDNTIMRLHKAQADEIIKLSV